MWLDDENPCRAAIHFIVAKMGFYKRVILMYLLRMILLLYIGGTYDVIRIRARIYYTGKYARAQIGVESVEKRK